MLKINIEFLFIFLIYFSVYDCITQTFLVKWHRYFPCDRYFAQIENQKRLCKE